MRPPGRPTDPAAAARPGRSGAAPPVAGGAARRRHAALAVAGRGATPSGRRSAVARRPGDAAPAGPFRRPRPLPVAGARALDA